MTFKKKNIYMVMETSKGNYHDYLYHIDTNSPAELKKLLCILQKAVRDVKKQIKKVEG